MGGKETTVLSPAPIPASMVVIINGKLRIVSMVSVIYFHSITLR